MQTQGRGGHCRRRRQRHPVKVAQLRPIRRDTPSAVRPQPSCQGQGKRPPATIKARNISVPKVRVYTIETHTHASAHVCVWGVRVCGHAHGFHSEHSLLRRLPRCGTRSLGPGEKPDPATPSRGEEPRWGVGRNRSRKAGGGRASRPTTAKAWGSRIAGRGFRMPISPQAGARGAQTAPPARAHRTGEGHGLPPETPRRRLQSPFGG